MMNMAHERLSGWEAEIVAALPRSWRVECWKEVASTMDMARGLSILPGAAALVMAERQSHGRGRQGRAWVDPAVGFLGTFVFSTERPIGELGGFSLAAGIAVYDVLRGLGCPVGLKWPNDVLSERGDKVSGILVELVSSGNITTVLTGIGVNLAGEPSGVPGVSSVAALSGAQLSAPQFAVKLAPALWDAWREFEHGGLEALRRRWLEGALYMGRTIAVDTGSETIRGVFTGIDSIGRLVLDVGGKAAVVTAGHIVERPSL